MSPYHVLLNFATITYYRQNPANRIVEKQPNVAGRVSVKITGEERALQSFSSIDTGLQICSLEH